MISSISGMGGGFTPPSPAQMRDKMFSAIDKSGDGTISKDEIKQLLSNSSKKGSGVDDIIKMLDSNQDGSVSKTEFDNVMEKMDPRKGGRTKAQDSDQDSVIKSLLDALNGAASADIKQQLFSAADADADGAISKDEFAKMHANAPVNGPSSDDIFKEIDSDGDGTISKTESDAFIDKMGASGDRQRLEGPPPPPQELSDSSTFSTGSDSDDNGLSVSIKALLELAKQSYLSATSTTGLEEIESLLTTKSWSA